MGQTYLSQRSVVSNPGGAGKEIKVQLIPDYKFYNTLSKLQIKKGTKFCDNLSRFLRLNDETSDKIFVRKLSKVIEEFLRNHYLKSFGYTKKRLEDTHRDVAHRYSVEEEEEYYYDEEDAPEETR